MPFEALRRTTRDRKYVLEEIEKVFPRLQQLQKEGLTAAEQAATINSLVEHLQAQKQKVTAVSHIDFADTAVVQACGMYCVLWDLEDVNAMAGPLHAGINCFYGRQNADALLTIQPVPMALKLGLLCDAARRDQSAGAG